MIDQAKIENLMQQLKSIIFPENKEFILVIFDKNNGIIYGSGNNCKKCSLIAASLLIEQGIADTPHDSPLMNEDSLTKH